MTTIVYDTKYDPRHAEKTLQTLARAIFYFGALASMLDGLSTWLVVRSAGVNIEQNWGMGWFMRHVGLVPTCIGRVLLGVACFWYVSNLLVGRRLFFRASRAAKYEAKMMDPNMSGHSRLVVNVAPYARAIETVFILAITCVVVGNNINAAVVWFHGHP